MYILLKLSGEYPSNINRGATARGIGREKVRSEFEDLSMMKMSRYRIQWESTSIVVYCPGVQGISAVKDNRVYC